MSDHSGTISPASHHTLPAERDPGIASTAITNEIVRYLSDPGSAGVATGAIGNATLVQRITTAVVKVIDRIAAGRYTGKIIALVGEYSLSSSDTTPLSESLIGTEPSQVDCEVWNVGEIAGGPPLAAGYIPAIIGPWNSYDTGLPTAIAAGPGGQAPMFPVKVEKTGGSNGTATTAASYTYTVRSLAGDVLGTGVSLARPRPAGAMVHQTGSSGYGLAFYDGTTLKLWDAGEVPETGTCPA